MKILEQMATVIYPSPIFGPIHSRRLGISLGINLMPGDGKICSFDCLYCECGFNKDHRAHSHRPSREEVKASLEYQLQRMKRQGEGLDVLTFAGNGEPTSHPDFRGIVEDTLILRDRYYAQAKVSVLSNATFILREEVFEALKMVDNNILKLDTVSLPYIKKIDRPNVTYPLEKLIEQMKRFEGHVIIQTMFLQGRIEGEKIDTTDEDYVEPWLQAVKEINPSQVMIYTIDRETPYAFLEKAHAEKLRAIAQRVEDIGIATSVAL